MTKLFESARGIVYPWDTDHMGHANVRWYADIFDKATWRVFHQIGLTGDYIRQHQLGMAGLQQTTQFKKELLPGDSVVLRSGITEIRQKTLHFFHVVFHETDHSEAAKTEFISVLMNLTTRKSTPFPEDIHQQALDNLIKLDGHNQSLFI